MNVSLESLLTKSWLKWFLPSVLVILIMLGIGLLGNALRQEHSPLQVSQRQESQPVALSQPLFAGLTSSEQPAKPASKQPPFFLEPLIEDSAEDLELSSEALLAMLACSLLSWGALALHRLKAQSRICQADFSLFAGLKPAPLFILLQVFRL